MDIIEKTRELGKMIQADERYKAYFTAKDKNDNDSELQKLIGDFNIKRLELNSEMGEDDKDSEKLKTLDVEIKELYAKIMANESMKEFTAAKNAMDGLLSDINNIITMCANGEDPDTCSPFSGGGCSGSCSTCGGCH